MHLRKVMFVNCTYFSLNLAEQLPFPLRPEISLFANWSRILLCFCSSRVKNISPSTQNTNTECLVHFLWSVSLGVESLSSCMNDSRVVCDAAFGLLTCLNKPYQVETHYYSCVIAIHDSSSKRFCTDTQT